ncbi:unnamed protein product [Paramecium primaurelia]|uniref:TLDc domain-containing protein n=1 Tax=Paramecium primaurelia TaxID=5886 RepID=A0A8S1QRB2_PARPR|nr:unnamed protein product [Paramecium primaurelia]
MRKRLQPIHKLNNKIINSKINHQRKQRCIYQIGKINIISCLIYQRGKLGKCLIKKRNKGSWRSKLEGISQLAIKIDNQSENQLKQVLIWSFESSKQFVKKYVESLRPNLLRDDYWIKIFYILLERKKKLIKQSLLIYQGTRDGLNCQQYWNKVNGKANLLMVFKSKSDYIFGAYSPCKWESCNGKNIEDNTLSSFIFSQTHDQIYPLKQDSKQYAIHCNQNYGPIFGKGYDILINGNFTDGYSNLGQGYQFEKYKNGSNDPYLFGQDKPEIKECEIYELQFV